MRISESTDLVTVSANVTPRPCFQVNGKGCICVGWLGTEGLANAELILAMKKSVILILLYEATGF